MARIKLINWVDSSHADHVGWCSRATGVKFAKAENLACQSVGFVIHENKRSVTLCESICSSQQAEMIKIPRVSIVWMLDITPKQKKKKGK
jgi:hypothetical protein